MVTAYLSIRRGHDFQRGLRPRYPEPLPAPPAPPRLPWRVSPDRRRILDAAGQPVLLQGDAAWSLIANTTLEGARHYLEDRRRLGFNFLIVSLIESTFSDDAPRNRAGDEPFTTPGDFRTPNEAYMAHAERVLEIAAEQGQVIMLHPAYLGYPALRLVEGWYEEVLANGVDGCRAWGEYLGTRFARFDNIVWSMGGDRNPGPAAAPLDALARGIKAAGGQHLFSAHVLPEHSPLEQFPGADWLDLNPTYTYETVHAMLEADWRRDPAHPFWLVETIYEGEHNASDLQIRRQAYWSVLCGGNGHCMGNGPALVLRGRLGGGARPAGLGRDGPLGGVLPQAAVGRAGARPRAAAPDRRPRRGARPRPGDGGGRRRTGGSSSPTPRPSGCWRSRRRDWPGRRCGSTGSSRRPGTASTAARCWPAARPGWCRRSPRTRS